MTDEQGHTDEMHSIARKFEATSIDSSFTPGISHTVDNSNDQMASPAKNIPERIIFVVDTARESDCTDFEVETGDDYSPLNMVKRVLEFFVHLKTTISSKHEFAIMKMTETDVHWVCDFTDNIKNFLSLLGKIEESQVDDDCRKFDLSLCFELIDHKIELNYGPSPQTVTRVVLIYSRSHCVPSFSDMKNFTALMENNYFFTDILYVHENTDDDNVCDKVYHELGLMNLKNNSYIFEVARNSENLHNSMAKLLAHPLRRPRQNETSYIPFCILESEQSTV